MQKQTIVSCLGLLCLALPELLLPGASFDVEYTILLLHWLACYNTTLLQYYCIGLLETVPALQGFSLACSIGLVLSALHFVLLHWLAANRQWLLCRGSHLLPDTATSAEQIYHSASFGFLFCVFDHFVLYIM